MNVYKFTKDRNNYQIIVASSIAVASQLCTIDCNKVSVLYKNVIVDGNQNLSCGN